MPELPEVNRVADSLAPILIGNQINKIRIYSHWKQLPEDLRERIYQQSVEQIIRHGKYLFFVLTSEVLMVHLGMSGSFRIIDVAKHHQKHDHYAFILREADCKVVYQDPRRFGRIQWATKTVRKSLLDPEQLDLPEFNLGIDALHPHLNPKKSTSKSLWNKWFFRKFLPTTPIKVCLLQQTGIAGIGNIYASEILHASQIHPESTLESLSRYQQRQIIKYSWNILRLAIQYGGTTIPGANKYYDPNNKAGGFSKYLEAYGKAGKRCQRCRTRIVKTQVRSRATYHCPKCQVQSSV